MILVEGIPPPTPADTFKINSWKISQLGQTVSIDVGTNRDDSQVTFAWDLGDGTTSTKQNISHFYAAKGTYTINLTATYQGEKATSSTDVTINQDSSFSPTQIDAFKQSINQLFDNKHDKAGMSVSIKQNGKIWAYAKGNKQDQEAMSTLTYSMLYSITKTFVSAQILNMVEDGDFALTDTVGTLLAQHPKFNEIDTNKINMSATVAQLLNHTSGIQDYTDNQSGLTSLVTAYKISGISAWSPKALLDLVKDDHTSTGTHFYSNTNYVLLGMIAEQKKGKTLKEVFQEGIVQKSGLGFSLAPRNIYGSYEAQPYDDLGTQGGASGTFGNLLTANPYFLDGMSLTTWAAAGIHAPSFIVSRWGYELYSDKGKALSTATRNQLLASADNSSFDNNYGYGVTRVNVELDGQTKHFYGHGGGGNGYLTILYYNKDRDASIAILTNSNNSNDNGNIQTFTDSDLYELTKTLLNQLPSN